MPELAPPVAPARPTRLVHENDVRIDPWFWLRDRDDPDVLEYLEAENVYTREALAHLSGLRRELYEEIVGRVQE
ncbi:MAG TPA: oligopeptidase B, partial [Acidimicrobiia bacterium]|nr:oligopeptidase B [Acidimicrobiia bacterium]